MSEHDEERYLAECEARREAFEARRANPTETRAASLFLWRNQGDPFDLPIPDEDHIEDAEDASAADRTIVEFIEEQGPEWRQAYDEADNWVRLTMMGYEPFARDEFPHGAFPGLIVAAMETATQELGRLAALGAADLKRSDVDDDDRERIEFLLGDVVADARRTFKRVRLIRDLTGGLE